MRFPFVLLALAFSSFAFSQEEDARPNLLLIVADDMGYGDLGCYGSLQVKTPHLDALSAAGVRCTDGYVTSSVCAPSRAGILTGRSGARFGFEHNLSAPPHVAPEFAGIPLDEPLLSDRLQGLGYRTGLVGKWHLGASVPEHHPLERGFDSFFGMLGGSHAYWPKEGKHTLMRGKEKAGPTRIPYLTDWFTLEAIEFIEGAGERRDASAAADPWFLMLSYNTPHGPMQAKPEDEALYAHIHHPIRRTYCAMQHCMDEGIGRIVDTLRERGELDNTLIVFLSDNGGSVEVSHAVNAPLRGTKGTFLEGGIRVPFLLHWPARIAPSVYSRPVTSLDLMATFVTAAGGKAPSVGVRTEREGLKRRKRPIYDSVDLLPYLSGAKPGDPHVALFWRMALRGSAVREGNWKLVRPNSQLAQLYDLGSDVGETKDLAREQPDVLKRLLGELNDWEGTLERNPVFLSASQWSKYNRRLYEREFCLTQPGPDDQRDLWAWSFKN